MTFGPEPVPTPLPEEPVQAETISTGVLIVATGLVIYLCYLVVQPFMTALAWALALAVIAHPGHRWLDQRMKSRSLCAGITVAAIVLLLMAPAAFVTHSLVNQATTYAGVVQQGIESGRWEQSLKENHYVGPLAERVFDLANPKADQKPRDDKSSEPENKPGQNGRGQNEPAADQETRPPDSAPEISEDPDQAPSDGASEDQPKNPGFNWSALGARSSSAVANAARSVTSRVGSLLTGAGWVGMQLLITVMCLFFFLRDRHSVLGGVRDLLPLSEPEADRIIHRVNDTIHATIFGSLTVAFVQGCMGGLMFWLLGLPSPLFWGALMGILAVVPVLGTFVIWAPTAAWLALQGDWTKAMILAGWGAIAIGLIDNLLYPFLVGNRMRFHTLLVFFSIVGGLSVFGAAGIILGPVLLAVSDGLLQVWHRRLARARASDV